jgi:hypothetical protein
MELLDIIINPIKAFLDTPFGKRFVILVRILGMAKGLIMWIIGQVQSSLKTILVAGTVSVTTVGGVLAVNNIQNPPLPKIETIISQPVAVMPSIDELNRVKSSLDTIRSDSLGLSKSIQKILDKPVESINKQDIETLQSKVKELETLEIRIKRDTDLFTSNQSLMDEVAGLKNFVQDSQNQIKGLVDVLNLDMIDSSTTSNDIRDLKTLSDTQGQELILIKQSITTLNTRLTSEIDRLALLIPAPTLEFANYTMDLIQQIPTSTAKTYIIYSQNSNWQPNPILPVPAFDGQILIFVNNASFSTNIQMANSSLSTPLSLTTGQYFISISGSSKWVRIN